MAMRLTHRSVKAVSAGVTATSLTSFVTAPFSVMVAAWALTQPLEMSRLWIAVAFLGSAITLGLAVGRRVAKTVRAKLVAKG